jgi:pimeloyl-ACP methyl ester carboxylesterase
MLAEFQPAVDTPGMRADRIESRFVETERGRVHVATAGLAAPAARVLFVHGSPGTWEAWKIWMSDPALRERARLLAPDRIGFGGSERGRAEGSLAAQAASLAAVLDAEAGPPAVVVGHSLGGPIAVRLAVDRPDLVASLLLVAPSIDPALEKRRWYNVAGSWKLVQAMLPLDWITSNRELWPLKQELVALEPRWPELAVAVVVVQGEDDKLVPAANAGYAEKVLPGRVDVHRHARMGHFLLWEKPETVTTPLLELLATAGAPR